MQAEARNRRETVYRRLDLTVIGETEVLEAAGIDPETPSYEEVETNEFIARFFWGLIQKKAGFSYWATLKKNCRHCRNI